MVHTRFYTKINNFFLHCIAKLLSIYFTIQCSKLAATHFSKPKTSSTPSKMLLPRDKINVSLVEIFQDEDDEGLVESLQNQCEGIVSKDGVKVFGRANLQVNLKFAGYQFILIINNFDTIDQFVQALWVLLSHRDQQQCNIANDSPSLMPIPFLVIIPLSAPSLLAFYRLKTSNKPLRNQTHLSVMCTLSRSASISSPTNQSA